MRFAFRASVLFCCRVAVSVTIVAGVAPRADAQTITVSAGDLRGALRSIGGPLGSQQSMTALSNLAALEVSTAPLGTSTGGFTYTFDPLVRVWTRSTGNFGPMFAERALTTGRGKVSAGFNWLHASYDSFAGQDLHDGSLRPAKNVRLPAGLPPVSYSSLVMNLKTDTAVLFGHAGVTDDLDVGVALPITQVSLDATGGLFNASNVNLQPSGIVKTSVSGVGDIALFAKYRFFRQEGGGAAAQVEVRMPTGEKDALRGLDVTRTLGTFIYSKGGRVSPHVNVGYEWWSANVDISSSGDIYARNSFKYAAGVEVSVTPRATAVIDFVGRTVGHGGQVAYQSFTANGGSIDALVGVNKGLSQTWLAPGLKWNVWQSVLITGNVLASLSTEGLRANLTPVLGVDWTF